MAQVFVHGESLQVGAFRAVARTPGVARPVPRAECDGWAALSPDLLERYGCIGGLRCRGFSFRKVSSFTFHIFILPGAIWCTQGGWRKDTGEWVETRSQFNSEGNVDMDDTKV